MVPGYYQVTIMVPSWILESYTQIGQNYGTNVSQNLIANLLYHLLPLFLHHFSILKSNQICAKSQYITSNQTSTECWYPQHGTRHLNKKPIPIMWNLLSKWIRNKKKADHDITIKLKHSQPPLDYENTTILYRKWLKQCYKHKEAPISRLWSHMWLFSIILSLMESPWSGLSERKEIWSVDLEIFMFKVGVWIFNTFRHKYLRIHWFVFYNFRLVGKPLIWTIWTKRNLANWISRSRDISV